MHVWEKRRKSFRKILEDSVCIQPASVYDPVSVRIAENLGYEMGVVGGSVASLAVLGAPDLIVLTLSEFAEQIHRISRASELPVMVDADHGYGNALNVMRTVEELEAAGVCCLSIEDTSLPVEFGQSGKTGLISIEEGVGKMRAALEARRDPDLVIAGRTGAAAKTGIADAVKRAKAYERAGVDAIFLVGVSSRKDLEAVAAEITLPLIIDANRPDFDDRDYLAATGVRVALQGHQPFKAATQAIHDVLKQLRDGIHPSALSGIASPELMQIVSRGSNYKKWKDDFLE